MSETLLWLLYCVSAAVAFALVYGQHWRIMPAMIAGALVTAAGWAVLYRLTDVDKRPEWITLDLSLNTCFGLIFAGAGAALAFAATRRGT